MRSLIKPVIAVAAHHARLHLALGFTGVYIFLIFDLKHRLWVHIRGGPLGGSNVNRQSMF